MRKYISYLLLLFLFSFLGYTVSEYQLFSRTKSGLESIVYKFQSSGKLDSIDVVEVFLDSNNKAGLFRQLKFFKTQGTLAKNRQEGKEFHKGRLLSGDSLIDAEFRIKGRYRDNYSNRKAFSIQVKSKKSMFGTKEFGLVPIHTKSDINEWVINELLRLESLPYFKVKILKIVLEENSYLGYLIPKYPVLGGKELNEVVKFNNDLNFELSSLIGRFDEGNYPFLNLKYKGCWTTSKKKKVDNSILGNGTEFNYDQVAKTIVFLKVFQKSTPAHGIQLHNVNFYLDDKEKLNIICKDQNFVGKASEFGVGSLIEHSFYRKFMKDSLFCKRFNYYLNYYSDEKKVDIWTDSLKTEMKKNVETIKFEKKGYDFTLDNLKKNMASLRRMAKSSVKEFQVNSDKFIINYGFKPEFIEVADSTIILYPHNKAGFPSFIKE